MSDKKHAIFEMANSDDPEGMIMAVQRSIIGAMKKVVAGLKADIKSPGLTWEQIEYLLDGFEKKKPEIIIQSEEM